MFVRNIDSELSLALLQPSFAAQYALLAKDNFHYLEQWLSWPPYCKSKDDFEAFIRKSLKDYAEGSSMTCAILYKGILVGNISFNRINQSLKKVEIGYWLAQPYQGRGIMTRACKQMIAIAFEELGMEKVQIAAAENNQPSRSVCERLGMSLEGVITNAENLSGRMVNHAIYGLHR